MKRGKLFIIFVFIILFSGFCMAQDLDEGLVAEWRFNLPKSSDVFVYDIDGRNNGTGYNIVHSSDTAGTAGEFARSYEFNGIDSYVEVPDSPEISSGEKNMTVSVWFKLISVPIDPQRRHIISKSKNTADKEYYLSVTRDSKLSFGYENHGDSWDDLGEGQPGTTILSVDTWYNGVFTYNRASKKLTLYLDGILEKSWTLPNDLPDTDAPLYFGKSGYYDRKSNVIIDEVKIYNRTLSDAEVSDLYSLGPSSEEEKPREVIVGGPEEVDCPDEEEYNDYCEGERLLHTIKCFDDETTEEEIIDCYIENKVCLDGACVEGERRVTEDMCIEDETGIYWSDTKESSENYCKRDRVECCPYGQVCEEIGEDWKCIYPQVIHCSEYEEEEDCINYRKGAADLEIDELYNDVFCDTVEGNCKKRCFCEWKNDQCSAAWEEVCGDGEEVALSCPVSCEKGECTAGIQTVECFVPEGCEVPKAQVITCQSLSEIPFFTLTNVLIAIGILIGFYFLRTKKK